MDWFQVTASRYELHKQRAISSAKPVTAILLAVGILMVAWPRHDSENPGPFPYTGAPLTAEARTELATGGWTLAGPDAPPWQVAVTRPPAAGETRWLVYFGGNTPGYLAEGKDILLSLDEGRGLGLAAFAPPGFDGSPGEPSPEALRESATNAMRWLVSAHPTAAQNIHLVGFSMGSMSALAAAQTLNDLKAPARHLVLFAPFHQMKVRPSGLLGYVFRLHRYDNRPLLRNKEQPPALVLHGAADSALPPLQGNLVSRALSAPIKVYPDIGHADLLKHPAALADARQGMGL
ncbi:hydrolase of the alpha/beta superfamily [Myxococcus hansupus]|uniref:Hydrolase of the alpha/beta superfamily n=1 Tax=Pseudomyxococcus hansupus TaxID=1297742 RepID=A0A0H4X0A2_9BACT|nr:alpha/beta hydrolase [Myxococcus hansupus]AKQ67308.1 hydrolase of the alpha/beta superfamily [Myxococcus hansupus]